MITAPTVLVIGSVNADSVIEVERIPRPGETVSGLSSRQGRGGKGANQARVAAGLGARTFLSACVGDDPLGHDARAALAEAGVQVESVRISPTAPTGTALVLSERSGENLIVTIAGANSELSAADAAAAVDGLTADSAVVLLSLEVALDTVLASAKRARERGFMVVLNPAPASPLPADLVALVDVLTPNEHELSGLLQGDCTTDLLLSAGVGAVVVTAGARGADVYRPGMATPDRVEAPSVEVIDTTGAGDAFNGALACALSEGKDLNLAVRTAVAAGSITVGSQGAQGGIATRGEIEDLMPALREVSP